VVQRSKQLCVPLEERQELVIRSDELRHHLAANLRLRLVPYARLTILITPSSSLAVMRWYTFARVCVHFFTPESQFTTTTIVGGGPSEPAARGVVKRNRLPSPATSYR
jgi:hypothetical protein